MNEFDDFEIEDVSTERSPPTSVPHSPKRRDEGKVTSPQTSHKAAILIQKVRRGSVTRNEIKKSRIANLGKLNPMCDVD